MFYRSKTRKPFAAPKPKKRSRTGKMGTVRLVGIEMHALRSAVYNRCNGFCEMKVICRGEYVPWKDGHLAHKKSRGSGGSDTESNTLWSCFPCHAASHNKGGKPVPTKGGQQ